LASWADELLDEIAIGVEHAHGAGSEGSLASGILVFHIEVAADVLDVVRHVAGGQVGIGETTRESGWSEAGIEYIDPAGASVIRRIKEISRSVIGESQPRKHRARGGGFQLCRIPVAVVPGINGAPERREKAALQRALSRLASGRPSRMARSK
jgi:hypothetical protein